MNPVKPAFVPKEQFAHEGGGSFELIKHRWDLPEGDNDDPHVLVSCSGSRRWEPASKLALKTGLGL